MSEQLFNTDNFGGAPAEKRRRVSPPQAEHAVTVVPSAQSGQWALVPGKVPKAHLMNTGRPGHNFGEWLTVCGKAVPRLDIERELQAPACPDCWATLQPGGDA